MIIYRRRVVIMEYGKVKNNIFKIILTVCAIVALCAAFVACDDGENDVKTFEESWMSYISDDATLGEIAIVGSHDAGTMNAGKAWATQHSTIAQQLAAGVRYFDFRATTNPSDGDAYYFIHANSDMPALGVSYGQNVATSFDAIKAFVERNTDEVLILDFQHTWVATEQGLIDLMKDKLPMDKVLTKTDCANPSAVTMGEMRELGKNIVIVYKDTTSNVCEENDFLFERSTFLQSDYVGSIHKGEPEELVAQWQTYFNAKKNGVLFVLQSQLTGSPLEGREALIRPLLDDYLKEQVATNEIKLGKINIVMKDFVADNVADCAVSSKDAIHTILSLNVDKGIVKTEKLDAFKTACGYQS